MNEKYTTLTVLKEDKKIIAEFLKARNLSWTDFFKRLSPVCKDMMALVEYPTLEIKLRV